MDTRITPKSTQHTGMSLSTEGSVAAWEAPRCNIYLYAERCRGLQ